MADYHILMCDVIGSSKWVSEKPRQDFIRLVTACNRALKKMILSPYTITLGDEFQGIAASLRAVVESIFYLEEERIKNQYAFAIRYVAHYGAINTPLNREIAYGMMGPGLTRARQILSAKRRDRPRFFFDLPDPVLSKNLNRLYSVTDALIARWSPKDYAFISDLLASTSNEEPAAKYDKNRSQIWKRRKHLLIEEYRALKEVIYSLTT